MATGEGGLAAWENGTLMVSRAERRHEGRYLCAANNGVGSGLSKVVALSVNGELGKLGMLGMTRKLHMRSKVTLGR